MRRYPLINLFGNASYMVFVATMTINFVLLPEFTRNHLNSGADVYAIGDMFWSIGSVAAGFFIGRIFVRDTVLGNIVCTALATLVLMTLAIERSTLFYYVLMFLFGFANAGTRVLRVAYLFRHIPNQVIGRTSSIFYGGKCYFAFIFCVYLLLAVHNNAYRLCFCFAIHWLRHCLSRTISEL